MATYGQKQKAVGRALKKMMAPLMTNTQNDSLTKAIAALGAIGVAPGRYAFRFKNDGSAWYLVSADDLANGYDALALLKRPATRKAPPWWTPQTQCFRYPETEYGQVVGERWVTADLTSGEEVPA